MADHPDKLRITDIIQLKLANKKVHSCAIIDHFYGQSNAWRVEESPTQALAKVTLENAIAQTERRTVLIKSDRETHYCLPKWIAICEKGSLMRSIPKKGCLPDNTTCEGFFGCLKNEFYYYRSWKSMSVT